MLKNYILIVNILMIFLFELKDSCGFRRPNILRCPSYPNINKIYNYSFSFDNENTINSNNFKYIINDKKKRNIYLRLRENTINRNMFD
jgi:hypothetical protein